MKDLKNAWLSPNGKLIVDHDDFDESGSWHLDLAACILKDLNGWKDKTDWCGMEGYFYRNVSDKLEEMGYIRLHGFGSLKPVWVVPCGKKITPRQEAVVLDWAIANKRKWNDCWSI